MASAPRSAAAAAGVGSGTRVVLSSSTITAGAEATSRPGSLADPRRSTSDEPLTLGYRVNLLQDGNRVHGKGFKTIENGVTLLPSERTPIEIEGRIEGNELVLNFTDITRDVTSRGVIRYRLGPGGSLRGRFSRDDAAGSGSSSAHRVQ